MNLIDFITNKSSKALEYGDDYIKATEKYIKLKVFEQLALTTSFLVKLSIILIFVFISVLFLAIALAIALGNWFNSIILGCLAVGFLFVLLMLIVYALRKTIDNRVIKSLSDNFFNSEENHEQIQ